MINVDVPTAIFLGLVAHLLGDYVIQSHWMACTKTERWWPAVIHAATYTIPFALITLDPIALAVIGGTHAVIDRYRLARHLCWLKNQMAPAGWRPTWSTSSATGYDPDRAAPGMAVALMIVADNTLHIAINTTAIAIAVA
jgi:hypothetical protein